VLTRRRALSILTMAFLACPALGEEPIPNWPAPLFWSPPKTSRGVATLGDITNPLPFVAVAPCRQYDSRNTTPLLQNTSRAVVATGAPCGLPTNATAVSVNITIFNISGATANGVFQVGTATAPTFAWINYPPTEAQRGNAGALPLDGSNQLWVRVQQGGGQIDFTVDVNGYYAATSSGSRLASGEFFGIFGTRGGDGVIYGENDSPTISSTGVRGTSSAGSGATFGVWGTTNSTGLDAAGIFGMDATGPGTTATGFLSAGIRGESATHIGVRGVSRYLGTVGDLYDSSGSTLLAEGLLGTTFGTAPGPFTGPWAVFSNGDFGATGAKHFVEPHPEDPTKVILYSSLEGPEVGTYVRARGKCVQGEARIPVPENFAMVTDENNLSVQAMAIGRLASFAVTKLDLSEVVLECSRNVEVFVTINGIRRAFKDFEPVANGMEFAPRSANARLPAYLTEEARRRLIANGTYNADGSVNLQTAERLGWTRAWREREEREKALAGPRAAQSDDRR
jgi:hypothetical protein